MNSSNFPKRQHTVTNSILKRFINSNGLLWVYDREKNEYREQHPDNTTVVKDFYTFTSVEEKKSYELEKAFNETLESKIPQIIDKIDNLIPINREEKEILATFVAFQQLKTTAFRKDFVEMEKEMYLNIAKTTFSDKERTKRIIEEVKKTKGLPEEKVNEEEIIELVANLTKENISIPQESHLQLMLKMTEETSNSLFQMDWFFLRAPKNTAFIISDNPFSLVGKPIGPFPYSGIGLLTPGAEKSMPLSPRTCLMMLNYGNKMQGLEVSREIVRSINCRTAARCDRYVIGNNKPLIERVVKITKINLHKREPQFVVSTPFSRMKKSK